MGTMTREQALQQLGNHMIPPEMAKGLLHPLRFLVECPKKQLRRAVLPGDTVVELGCGSGFFTRYLVDLVGREGRIYATDVQPEMLDMARQHVNGSGRNGTVEFHLSPGDRIGLDVQSADAVVLIHTLHEAANTESFLSEAVGFLRAGGRFLFMEPKNEVPEKLFAWEVKLLEEQGLVVDHAFSYLFGRGVLFCKPGKDA
jgi:ubiquinone/menaquinone biosynthesis C-methylase UbiE